MGRRGQGWPLGSGRRRLVTRSQPRGHRRPRGTEGTHPGRISTVWNVTTPSGSGCRSGKPTARKAQLPGGRTMVQEANAGGPKGRQEREAADRSLQRSPRPTGRIQASCLARKGADVDQVSL
jgi:hypothetical protein